MLFGTPCIGRVDEYIVKVTQGDVLNIGHLTIVDVSLKRSRWVCQPEGHNFVFELTIAGSEYRLEFFSSFDSDEVVGIPEAQLSEDLGFVHSIE